MRLDYEDFETLPLMNTWIQERLGNPKYQVTNVETSRDHSNRPWFRLWFWTA